MKLQSDRRAECSGSCSECVRSRRLWRCDAVDGGGNSACRTWFDRLVLLFVLVFSERAVNNRNSLPINTEFSSLARFMHRINSLQFLEFRYIKC